MNVKFANSTSLMAMIALLSPATGIFAETDITKAKSNCRSEAVSTGLEDEADIKAYVDLCMQAWQMPEDEVNPDLRAEDVDETSTDDSSIQD
jgi:hypothetical protein